MVLTLDIDKHSYLSGFSGLFPPFLRLRRHPLRPHTLERLRAGIQRGFNEPFKTPLRLLLAILLVGLFGAHA
jgi:hypothetical protein